MSNLPLEMMIELIESNVGPKDFLQLAHVNLAWYGAVVYVAKRIPSCDHLSSNSPATARTNFREFNHKYGSSELCQWYEELPEL